MNKNQTILAAIGGVTVVGALVLGYLIWDAASERDQNSEAMEESIDSAVAIMKKLPVKPVTKELAVYDAAAAGYDEWRAAAEQLAAAGDSVYETTTPAVFKTELMDDARRIASLPGVYDGKLVKADFHFGFRDYILGGALPPDKPTELARLQREWADVSGVLKTLAECGVAGISDVRMGKPAETAAGKDDDAKAKGKGKAKGKAKGKKAAKAEDAEAAKGPAITSFTVDFQAKPSALVKAINAFAAGERFIVVENFSFVRESDALAEKLGGSAKKQEATSGRRRRRDKQAADAAEQDEAKTGLVIDPVTAPALKVTMVFSVYDFGSLERAKAEAAAADGAAGEVAK